MSKKVFSFFMIFCLILAFVIPSTAGAATPKIGDTKVETIYLANSQIMLHGAGAAGIERLLKKKASTLLIPGIGWAGAAATVAAYLNEVAGNNGIKLTVTYTYKKQRVFDTYEWVEYTGWGLGSYKYSIY